MNISSTLKEILAWAIHYTIGFVFVLVYSFLWKYEAIDLSVLNGLSVGAISGIIAIIGWKIMFQLSGFERKAKDKRYYIQLFVAHIIFGVIAILTLSFLRNEL